MSDLLSKLFRAEAPRLTRLLRRLGPPEVAEDMAQQSFAQLCAARPVAVEPRAYLFQVARNLAIDEMRRRAVAPFRAVADPDRLEVASSAPSPEDELIAAETVEQVRRLLASLPARERDALLLFKLEGLTHKEIGKRLGVSVHSARRYIARALATCHKALAAEEIA